eukprot:Rmarinus@m.11734
MMEAERLRDENAALGNIIDGLLRKQAQLTSSFDDAHTAKEELLRLKQHLSGVEKERSRAVADLAIAEETVEHMKQKIKDANLLTQSVRDANQQLEDQVRRLEQRCELLLRSKPQTQTTQTSPDRLGKLKDTQVEDVRRSCAADLLTMKSRVNALEDENQRLRTKCALMIDETRKIRERMCEEVGERQKQHLELGRVAEAARVDAEALKSLAEKNATLSQQLREAQEDLLRIRREGRVYFQKAALEFLLNEHPASVHMVSVQQNAGAAGSVPSKKTIPKAKSAKWPARGTQQTPDVLASSISLIKMELVQEKREKEELRTMLSQAVSIEDRLYSNLTNALSSLEQMEKALSEESKRVATLEHVRLRDLREIASLEKLKHALECEMETLRTRLCRSGVP